MEGIEMKGRILMEIRVNIAPEKEQEFNQWYNNVHVPEIVAVPGFISGRRFQRVSGDEIKYMALYELESLDALRSEAFKQVRGWHGFEAFILKESWNVYRQIYPED
jgi:antibiotic biosynthesis monooxygenase (ABM) superfamily enzyme